MITVSLLLSTGGVDNDGADAAAGTSTTGLSSAAAGAAAVVVDGVGVVVDGASVGNATYGHTYDGALAGGNAC